MPARRGADGQAAATPGHGGRPDRSL